MFDVTQNVPYALRLFAPHTVVMPAMAVIG